MHCDRLIGRDRAREFVIGHVGPAPGAVDREEAKAGRRQTVQMGVSVGDVLAGELRRAVERNRGFDPLTHREGQLPVRAVDGGGRRVDEMQAVIELSRRLENRDLPHDIGVHIEFRPLDRIAHARLRREMDDVGRVGMAP